MAKRDTRRRFLNLARDLEPQVQRAFTQSIRRLTDNIQFRDLENAIRLGDTPLVLQILNLSADHFEPLAAIIGETYVTGAGVAIATIPRGQRLPSGARANIVFTGARPAEAALIQSTVNNLITGITSEAEEATRAILSQGLINNRTPRQVAYDLVGKVNASGVRRGGVLGLSAKDAMTINSVQVGLRTGDRDRFNSYFSLEGRDKRLDGTVRKAFNAGAVPESLIDRVSVGMSNKYLLMRGETVALTETLTVLTQGREQGYQRLLDEGVIDPRTISKTWDATADNLTRPSHSAIDGTEIPFSEAFVLDDGSRLMFPRDRSLNAPGSQTIRCRCYHAVRVDYIENARLSNGG